MDVVLTDKDNVWTEIIHTLLTHCRKLLAFCIFNATQCHINGGARGAAAPGPAVLGPAIGGSVKLVIGL